MEAKVGPNQWSTSFQLKPNEAQAREIGPLALGIHNWSYKGAFIRIDVEELEPFAENWYDGLEC